MSFVLNSCVCDAIDWSALLEGCIAKILSLTSPEDVCRLSLVCKVFKSVGESDIVWEAFLPVECCSISPSLASVSSKKEFYFRLFDHPILIKDDTIILSLDRKTGAKRCMFSARRLSITSSDNPMYWKWISHQLSGFPEVAEQTGVCFGEIEGRINASYLTPGNRYLIYLVFQEPAVPPDSHFLSLCATTYFCRHVHTLHIHLNGELYRPPRYSRPRRISFRVQTWTPNDRGDGWWEVMVGQFMYTLYKTDDLRVLIEKEDDNNDWKGGLILQGLEIRPDFIK